MSYPHLLSHVLLAGLVACGCPKPPAPVEPNGEPAAPPDAAVEKPAVPADHGAASCQCGEIKACDLLAETWGGREFLPEGRGEEGKAAAAVLHDACDNQNISSACMGLALMYKYGTATGGVKDKETSNKYWARVAELGDLNSLRGAPPSEESQKVLQAAKDGCKNGRARACVQLGWATYGGVQMEASPPKSFSPYEQGCIHGSGQGCRWAGHIAREYRAAPPDRAEELLRRGCYELKSHAACAELGHFLELIRHDLRAAIPLLETACADGLRVACQHLGDAHERANGPPAVIAKNFLIACEAGAKPACASLVKHTKEDCTLDLATAEDGDLGPRAVAAAKKFCEKDKGIEEVAAKCAGVKACE